MAKKRKIPAIRFKGFSDAWEEKTFDDQFSSISSNTLSRAQLNYDSGLAKNVHYGDVLIKFGELLDVKKEEIPFISSDELVGKFKKGRLQDGDIIIADAAEDETVGKCTEIMNIGDEVVLSGLHTIAVRPKLSFAPKYLGYYMNSPAYHNQLLQLMQGTKVSSISKSAIKNTSVFSPIEKSEQAQIGTYLQKLDQMICLHEQKHEKLVTLKKTMLKKMFPQNGAKIPEIRFKGFSEPWEEKKLGELMEVASVKRIHQSDWTSFGIRFLRARDIVSASQNKNPAEYLYISKEKYDEYSLISGKVKIGDLLVTGVGTIGVPLLISDSTPVYFKDGNIIWFRNNNEINGMFFYYSFTSDGIQNFIKESAGIGTVGTYTIDSGKKTPLIFPNQAEQQKIGEYFRQLDELIAKHAEQGLKLKQIKTACLEKMFV